MGSRSRWLEWLPAVLCAALIPLCALVVHPSLEMGINDDFSYVKTVQVLARTGHVVYNGWATAMLGWQLYLGALFVRLFGFSFTVVRSSVVVLAMLTAILLERTLRRAGLNRWNAAAGTLAFIFSPLFFPLIWSFMTDVAGMLAIVLCLYCALRVLTATVDGHAMAWLAGIAVASVVGGTARQIVWVGVLAMLPATVFLIRQRRTRLVPAGAVLWCASLLAIVACLHWYGQQPYALPEHVLPRWPARADLLFLFGNMVDATLDTPLFLLPVLILFVPLAMRRGRGWLVGGTLVGTALGLAVLLRITPLTARYCLAPFMNDYFTVHGTLDGTVLLGQRPLILHHGGQILLTAVLAAVLVSFLAIVFSTKGKLPEAGEQIISRRDLTLLVGSFAVGYALLLLPRGTFYGLVDRYLLPLVLFALILLLRYVQDCVQPRLPMIGVAAIVGFAVFGIAETHDALAMMHARLRAIDVLRAAGVPADRLDGAFEFNAWTQIDERGYMNDSRLQHPAGAYQEMIQTGPDDPDCELYQFDRTPVVRPLYRLSFDPDVCAGRSPFPPAVYHAWLGPHRVPIYIVAMPPHPPYQVPAHP